MLNILKDEYKNEHYTRGFLETKVSLPKELISEIKVHYEKKAIGHNDFPKFFVNNEHQSYIESRVLGTLLNTFPKSGRKMVKRFYDKAYSKGVYCEQVFIENVLNHLLANGFQRFFKTRYIVASYDMYLRNTHVSPAAGIHTDLPNFHHFYETENDLSLYIPLVDFDEKNGGRLKVLPENKLKVPGNVLLKLLLEHFSRNPDYLDENGYVDPNNISPKAIAAFVKSKPHQELMGLYKGVIALAKRQYAGEFETTDESAGRVLLFNNKNFHAAEPWKNTKIDREVYVIRMTPLYDVKIRLKRLLHGTLVNNFLIDMDEGKLRRFDHEVNVRDIPSDEKVAF